MAFQSEILETPISVRFSIALSTLATDVKNYRLYSKTVAELQKLTNRELEDLGLNRATINTAATKAVYGY
jgi:uncharacterized protein YjiS (DUF1127 family)